MAAAGMPLLVHGEVTGPEVDIFDREARFLEEVLAPLLTRVPRLRVVLEHITTREAVQFVVGAPSGRVGATVTPQHMLLNRNALLAGGLRPHNYCLPILKREVHRCVTMPRRAQHGWVSADAPASSSQRGSSGGSHQRRLALFLGHRQRAPRARRQRVRVRLRGRVFGACGAPAVRAGVRGRRAAAQFGGLCVVARARFLWTQAQCAHRDVAQAALESAPRVCLRR